MCKRDCPPPIVLACPKQLAEWACSRSLSLNTPFLRSRKGVFCLLEQHPSRDSYSSYLEDGQEVFEKCGYSLRFWIMMHIESLKGLICLWHCLLQVHFFCCSYCFIGWLLFNVVSCPECYALGQSWNLIHNFNNNNNNNKS